MAGNGNGISLIKNSASEITFWRLQTGSKLLLDYPISSHAGCFHNLRKALGVQANCLQAIDTNGQSCRSSQFVCGIDCEKMLGLAFTGQTAKKTL
jgi:hypothetical protein